ncbi:MAG: tetratricopeptide repeat protein [Planctomycetales bacterium]|nr:tetratricopeptide repeat protein [Planctomycetales bacterium]
MNAILRQRIGRVRREAEGYLELGMPEHALAVLQKHGKLTHGDARGCYLLGESLRELHRYRQAVYPLQRSLELIPDDVNVHMALAWCYKRTGQLQLAIDLLEHALQIEPGAAILHYNLACYWSLACDRRRTLQYLAAALEIDGNFRDFVWDEPDFDPMRSDPLFRSLTGMTA